MQYVQVIKPYFFFLFVSSHSIAGSILALLMLSGAALDLYIGWFETPQSFDNFQILDGDNKYYERVHLLRGTSKDSAQTMNTDTQCQDLNGAENKQGTTTS